MNSLSLHAENTLVGVRVSVAAAHGREVHGARHNLLRVGTRRLPDVEALQSDRIMFPHIAVQV